MQRRNFLVTSGYALGSLLVPRALLGNVFQEPWKITMLRNNVGVFTERGGTIAFLLTKKGNVVVDSQFPDQSKHLIDEIKKRSEEQIHMLINTHHHGDHTGGNIAFKGIVRKVVGHANCLANHKRVSETQKNADRQLFADTTFSDTWTAKCGNERIKAHYFGPAHTNGDAIIHFQHANIAHMGDLVFNRRYAFIDRNAGASISNWVNVLEKTISNFDNETIFVFGHAFDPVKITGNKDDLRAMQHYLSKLLSFVEAELTAGKTKEEILKAKSIPGVTEWQGDGIERGLQAAIDEIVAKK